MSDYRDPDCECARCGDPVGEEMASSDTPYLCERCAEDDEAVADYDRTMGKDPDNLKCKHCETWFKLSNEAKAICIMHTGTDKTDLCPDCEEMGVVKCPNCGRYSGDDMQLLENLEIHGKKWCDDCVIAESHAQWQHREIPPMLMSMDEWAHRKPTLVDRRKNKASA